MTTEVITGKVKSPFSVNESEALAFVKKNRVLYAKKLVHAVSIVWIKDRIYMGKLLERELQKVRLFWC